MSESRTIHTLDGKTHTVTLEEQQAAAKEAARIRADKKARFVRVLERGFTIDRLQVDLPPDVYGEWVPLDQIERWRVLGFEIDTEYAPKRQLHGAGDGSGRIGDTVFMICSREDHDLMEEVKHEMFVMTHGSPEEKRRLKQQEEQEFTNVVETQIGLPVVDESVEHQARKSEIREALGVRPSILSTPK